MKKFDLFLMEEAELDIDEAFIWYEMQKPGLGIEFIENLEKSFQFIIKNPLASEKLYLKTHRQI